MSVLIIHQIDAAYWKEWEMFYLPGGIQGFLLFNKFVIPIVLVGYEQVVTKSLKAKLFSYVCGFLGILTFLLHSGFALFGAEQFHLPLSILIIVLFLIFGVWQVLRTKQTSWE